LRVQEGKGPWVLVLVTMEAAVVYQQQQEVEVQVIWRSSGHCCLEMGGQRRVVLMLQQRVWGLLGAHQVLAKGLREMQMGKQLRVKYNQAHYKDGVFGILYVCTCTVGLGQTNFCRRKRYSTVLYLVV
jgi:hypothetical protein